MQRQRSPNLHARRSPPRSGVSTRASHTIRLLKSACHRSWTKAKIVELVSVCPTRKPERGKGARCKCPARCDFATDRHRSPQDANVPCACPDVVSKLPKLYSEHGLSLQARCRNSTSSASFTIALNDSPWPARRVRDASGAWGSALMALSGSDDRCVWGCARDGIP